MYTNYILTMDVYTDQHTISQDFLSKDVLFDTPDLSVEENFSDKEEWPTEECFQIIEILKWRDISDGIYRIQNVTYRKGKFGNISCFNFKTKR